MNTRITLITAVAAVAIPSLAFAGEPTSSSQDPQQNQAATTGQERTEQGVAKDRDRPGDMNQTVITGRPAEQVGNAQTSEQNQADSQDMKKQHQVYFEQKAGNAQYQHELDRMAAEKSENPQVKQFAQSSAERQQQKLDQTRKEAEQAGVSLSDKPQLSDSQNARLEELRQKEGQEFDKSYAFETQTNRFRSALEESYVSQNGQSDWQRQSSERSMRDLASEQREVDGLLLVFMDPAANAQTAGSRQGGQESQQGNTAERPRTPYGQEGSNATDPQNSGGNSDNGMN